MSQGWMVRSGRGGAYVEYFLKHNVIAIGWNDLEVDLSNLSQDDIVVRVQKTYPNYHRSAVSNVAAQTHTHETSLTHGMTYFPHFFLPLTFN